MGAIIRRPGWKSYQNLPDGRKLEGERILNSPDNKGMEDRTNGTYRTYRIFCQMNPIGLTSLTDSGLTNPIGPISPIGPNSPTGLTCPINQPMPVS